MSRIVITPQDLAADQEAAALLREGRLAVAADRREVQIGRAYV